MRRVSAWFVLILVAISSGCGGGLEWKGKVSGELNLTDDKGVINEKGSGSATLESGLDNRVKFSKEATLANCDIRFGDGDHDTGRSFEKRFKVKDAEKVKCKASLGNGTPPVDVEIRGGGATLTDSGEFSMVIYYSSVDTGERRNLSLTGKKAWF